MFVFVFFFQAEDGIRDLVRSRGLGDVYKRQAGCGGARHRAGADRPDSHGPAARQDHRTAARSRCCLLYTSDAADERSSVDLGGRRIIKKKKNNGHVRRTPLTHNHTPTKMSRENTQNSHNEEERI